MAEIDVTLVSDDQLIDVPLATVFGTGIVSIEQTVTSEDPEIPNEITCTLTNGVQTKFYIRNGDGDSPTITIEQAAEGYAITIVDKDGVHTSSIIVDSTLDAESANPIQNGAVAGAVTQLTSDITAVQTSVGEAVKYTAQSLTEAQKTQARSNIDVPSSAQLTTVSDNLTALSNDVVRISAQSLTEAQKAQVRTNIGVAGDGIFRVTIGTTTGTEILNAVTNGRYPIIEYDESGVTWFLTPSVLYTLNGTHARSIFEGEVGGDIRQVRLEGDTNWSAVVSDEHVTSVNNKTGAVSLSASDVGALPSSTVIPSKTSDLTNDSGFLTQAVTSVNGQTGAVTLPTATTSADGLMSSTDKSRLDALYADYSSAMTALGVS